MAAVTPQQVKGLQLALWSSPAHPPLTAPVVLTAPLAADDAEISLAARLAEALDALSADDRRYLRGPVVFHMGSDACPDWLRTAIPAARLSHLRTAQSSDGSLATLEEALAYLASASLAFPLAEDDAALFFWLSQEVCPKYGLARDEPVWKSLGYAAPVTLSNYQEHHLRDLRAKLRAAVVKHARRGEAEDRLRHPAAEGPVSESPRHAKTRARKRGVHA